MDLAVPVYPIFILFCRVGGCLMTAPGFSSERVPVQFRLYMAIAATLALAPPLLERHQSAFVEIGPQRLLATILAELGVGVTLGLLARYYFFAFETLSTTVAMTIGLDNIFGTALTEQEPTPSLSSFVILGALLLVFCADLHLELIRALYLSYDTTPLFSTPSAGAFLEELSRILTESHLLALRICSPFLLFGLVVNVALGLLARLTPQLQIYFVSGPLAIFLGVSALFVFDWDFFSAFVSHYGAWLIKG
jgi:flagellar biosynthetic protein FliR